MEKIAEAMRLLLIKIDTPEDEIEEIVENVYEGRLEKMFEMAAHYSVKETRALAREEGEKNKAIQIALNLLKAGVTKEIISQSTGLNIEELEKLVSSPIKES